MGEEEFKPENLHKLVESAVNPKAHYRRSICRRLAFQTLNQFGTEGLFDLMSGIDDAGQFQTLIIADRDEIDNYLFQKYGIFDNDMFEKVQLSEEWNEFLGTMMEQGSAVLEKIIQSEVEPQD
jgi:hypothetical protein